MVRTRAQAKALVVTLDTLPDDTFQQVIDAFCSNGDDLPPLLLRSEGPYCCSFLPERRRAPAPAPDLQEFN